MPARFHVNGKLQLSFLMTDLNIAGNLVFLKVDWNLFHTALQTFPIYSESNLVNMLTKYQTTNYQDKEAPKEYVSTNPDTVSNVSVWLLSL